MAKRVIKVGILGLGIVGGGVAQLLMEQKERLSGRLGAELVLAKAADRDASLARELGLPAKICCNDAEQVVNDPDIDIVVELIGGLSPAKEFMLQAIENGKQVATANKALLAHHGVEILAAAKKAKVSLGFEASTGGGIPLIGSLREGLAANEVSQALGILNGTSNYILTQMTNRGQSFDEALAEAQAAGFAEADPTFDVEGIDASHKLAIITALVTGKQPRLEDIPVQGISRITPLDIKFANDFGYKIKLLALLRNQGGRVEARVHPALIPHDHVLASVDSNFNALHLTGDWVGDVLLYGQGAGRRATASAVVADVLSLARDILAGCSGRLPALGTETETSEPLELAPLEEAVCQYYFRFTAEDQPGVLASISHFLGDHGISIEAVTQKGIDNNAPVPVVMLTHQAKEAAVQKALAAIDNLPAIAQPTLVIRKAWTK